MILPGLQPLTLWVLVLFAGSRVVLHANAASSKIVTYSMYSDAKCTSTPNLIAFSVTSSSCSSTSTSCTSISGNDTSFYLGTSCTSDAQSFAESAFDDSAYLLMQIYGSSGCSSLTSAVAFLADGTCVATDYGASSVKAYVHSNGTATLKTYDGTSCSGSSTKNQTVSSSALSSHSCVSNYFKFYVSEATTSPAVTSADDDESTASSSTPTAASESASTASSSSATTTSTTKSEALIVESNAFAVLSIAVAAVTLTVSIW